MAGVETIGNYDVKPLGNGKYSVALNNGNMGAAVVDEAAVQKLREKYNKSGDSFEKSKSHKGAVIGATTGVIGGAALSAPSAIGYSVAKDLIKTGSFAEKRKVVKFLRTQFPKAKNLMKALKFKVGTRIGMYVAGAALVGTAIGMLIDKARNNKSQEPQQA